jgi:hypothetical protein
MANRYCATCHDLRPSKIDDANSIYFINLMFFKIQLSCHVAKVNWAMWINLKPSNIDN